MQREQLIVESYSTSTVVFSGCMSVEEAGAGERGTERESEIYICFTCLFYTYCYFKVNMVLNVHRNHEAY